MDQSEILEKPEHFLRHCFISQKKKQKKTGTERSFENNGKNRIEEQIRGELMNWPLFNVRPNSPPLIFKWLTLHQKFQLNFDILLFGMIIFLIDQLVSFNL